MKKILDSLQNIENIYAPYCYWGWLENITPQEAVRQVRLMHDAHIGGYVMHARGGLTMPYAGKQWMDSVRAMLKCSRELGMIGIVDDEHGWPSGFGAGRVNGKGDAYQLKYLLCEECRAEECAKKHGTLGLWRKSDYSFVPDAASLTPDETLIRVYERIDALYVDNMSKDVVQAFIECSYGEYEREAGQEFGKGLFGIFSDEPQTARYATPWSDTLPELFEREYGYSLLPRLYLVFTDMEGCAKLRLDLYRLMQRLFAENYAGQIQKWCEERGIAFMGHTCLEEHFAGQLRCSAGTMPFYKNMTIPGIDWLTRTTASNLCVLQMTSVARQTGKKRALCEMFGCSGWNVSFEELKWIAQKQMLLGVDLQLQHLGLYSLRGSRKREYPASLFFQQPWFGKFSGYNDYFARIAKLLSESTFNADVLLIHPMYSVFTQYNGREDSCDDIQNMFDALLKKLLMAGIFPDLGDETLMQEMARIEDGKLIMGECSYDTVIVPPMHTIGDATQALLREFARQGGRLLTGDMDAATDAVKAPVKIVPKQGENDCVYLARREYRGRKWLYIVNDDLHKTIDFAIESPENYARYDPLKNTLAPFDKNDVTLLGAEALILFETEKNAKTEKTIYKNSIELKNPKLVSVTPNVLTLDHCEYSFDGINWEGCAYVLDLQKKLLSEFLNRLIYMRFTFDSEIEDTVWLLDEIPTGDPQKQKIFVNGREITQEAQGYAIDPCFEKIPIKLQKGKNTVMIERWFRNSDEVYKIKNCPMHEAEANRVTVTTELEAIYIYGDFAVDAGRLTPGANGTFVTGESNCRCVIKKPNNAIDAGNLLTSGYPFFGGSMTLEYKLAEPVSAKLVMDRPNATMVTVNGKDILWSPWETEIENTDTIRITLTNSLRNMLGPHYSKDGESIAVGPFSYSIEAEGKHFVPFGITGLKLLYN